MNNARRWVFGWQATLFIALTLVTQFAGVLVLDLATTRGVVLLGLWTSAALLSAQAAGGWYGLWRRKDDGHVGTPAVAPP